jgi:hypothetical protein
MGHDVIPVMMGHDVIPCSDGAGCDIVDVIQKGLDESMIQQSMLNKYVDCITEGDEKTNEEDDDFTGAGKLNIHDFIEWNEALELELWHKKGVAGVPLDYAIWDVLHLVTYLLMQIRIKGFTKSDMWGWSGERTRSRLCKSS